VTLDTTINQVNANFQIVTELLKSILDAKTVASLKQSADSLQQVTKVLADNTDKLNAIVANTERASRRIDPLLQSSDAAVRALQTQTLPEANLLLQSSNDTVTALQTQILPEAHRALFNLDNLSSSFTDLATRINRDPSIVIRGTAPRPLGPGEEK
jgi:phospholipid/cholesterol/gamma-HCH transport system substrate-binding protein